MEPTTEMQTLLAQGGKFRVRTYTDGSGVPGSQVLSVEPNVNVWNNNDTMSKARAVGIGFISGIMLAGVVAFVIAMAIMLVVVVSHDGTTNQGVSHATMAILVYSWTVVTLLGGMAFAAYNAAHS
jgi:hypothetical protein